MTYKSGSATAAFLAHQLPTGNLRQYSVRGSPATFQSAEEGYELSNLYIVFLPCQIPLCQTCITKFFLWDVAVTKYFSCFSDFERTQVGGFKSSKDVIHKFLSHSPWSWCNQQVLRFTASYSRDHDCLTKTAFKLLEHLQPLLSLCAVELHSTICERCLFWSFSIHVMPPVEQVDITLWKKQSRWSSMGNLHCMLQTTSPSTYNRVDLESSLL